MADYLAVKEAVRIAEGKSGLIREVMAKRATEAAALRWEWHDPICASLMLGRIELAQITQGGASGQWFWMLRFTEKWERTCFSAPTEDEARLTCEEHARKVLA